MQGLKMHIDCLNYQLCCSHAEYWRFVTGLSCSASTRFLKHQLPTSSNDFKPLLQ